MPKVTLTSDGALPVERSSGMQVAYGDRQCIGGVHGLGRFGELKQAAHHVLDLLLFRAAVTDDANFDLKRRVFADCETGFGSLKESDAADVRQLEGRLGIHGVKDLFDSDESGRVIAKHGAQVGGNVFEAEFESEGRLGANDTRGYESVGPAIGIDNTETGALRSAVDAYDSHG